MADIPDNQLTLVFPQLPDFPITRTNTALIVIDMQKLDAHPDHGIGARARDAGIGSVFDYYWTAGRTRCWQPAVTADGGPADGDSGGHLPEVHGEPNSF